MAERTLDAQYSEMLTRPDDSARLPFDRLPEPDYERHPAYGGVFPKPSFALRLKAIKTVAPWLAFVLAKRMLLFDRLPALPHYSGPKYSGGALGSFGTAPRYVPLILRAWVETIGRLVSGGPKQPASAEGKSLLERMRDRGIAVTQLSADQMNALKEVLGQPVTSLLKKREAAEKVTFEGNQMWLNEQSYPNVYSYLNQLLEDRGVLPAGSVYLGRPIKVIHAMLQINDTRDSFHHNKFGDVGCPDPETNYMHIDTSYEILKCAIYLNEVDESNGPFSYVLGSPRLRVGFFEGLVRRAMDRSGLTGYSRATRELFMALPAFMRRKCTFGSDLAPASPAAAALVAAEYHAVTADGNLVLFDNLGIHRGALVKRGERRMLFVTLG